MSRDKFYIISRNMQICSGKSCEECFKFLPALETGPVRLAGWAAEFNEEKINDAIAGCPVEALGMEEI